MLISSDDTFEAFLAACFDNPTKCPLASLYESPEETAEAVLALFEKLKSEPFPVFPEEMPPVLLDYALVSGVVLSMLYGPPQYQALSIALAGLLQDDPTAWVEAFLAPTSNTVPQQAEAVMGIRCGDKIPRTDELSDLDDLDQEFHETTKYFPGWTRGWYVYACAQWPFEAKERYEGDFNVATSNPILFIGNTYDPVTPLASAQNMSAGFEGSVVLQHNGFGHTSIPQQSNCTNEVIAKYFIDGTLPEDGTVCEPNVPLFGDDEEISGGDAGDAPADDADETPTSDLEGEDGPAEGGETGDDE